MSAHPYRDGARHYDTAGWRRYVPLDRGKGMVPKGVSGHQGADPTPEQRELWLRTKGDANGCIILPEGSIGLDVDDYVDPSGKVKRGGATLAHADKLWGPRPPKCLRQSDRRHQRDQALPGVAGTPLLAGQIKFVLDDGTVLSDIEIVQHHHRNVNCWPTVHGGTRTAVPVAR